MVEASLVNTVQTVGILVGIAIALWQLKDIKQTRETELETRQAQLFQQIHDKFHDTEFWEQFIDLSSREWKDTEDYYEKYSGPENIRSRASWAAVGAYYEGIGVMVHRNLVDISLVYDLTHSPIFVYWEKYEDIIRNSRERLDNPEIWKWIEYLYNELKDYEKLIQQPHN